MENLLMTTAFAIALTGPAFAAGLFSFVGVSVQPVSLCRFELCSLRRHYARKMNKLRSYLAVMLSLMLVQTGSAMAQARMMNPATGEMVLCTGNGPVAVPVDAQGQPTGKSHVCPDCALAVVAVLIEQPTLSKPFLMMLFTSNEKTQACVCWSQTHKPINFVLRTTYEHLSNWSK